MNVCRNWAALPLRVSSYQRLKIYRSCYAPLHPIAWIYWNGFAPGMAKLGYELTLCHANDLDLIQGKASAQKQLRFLEQLVAVIPAVSDSSTCSSPEESLLEMVCKNGEFMKQVFCSPDLQAVLNPQCHPWSSDIKHLLADEEVLHKRPLLSEMSHEKTIKNELKKLEDTVAALKDLKAQCPFLQEDLGMADASLDSATTLQTLKLIASDFSQLLLAFEQVYESELQKNSEQRVLKLSPCGPLFQDVHESLTLCVQELQSLAQVTETSSYVMETEKQTHGEKVFWSGSVKSSLCKSCNQIMCILCAWMHLWYGALSLGFCSHLMI
uniref:HAUS augmin like complex subunit 7 n=1 Tax=Anolis carolinensis TaxID=28377 RepID=A0A803TNP5_ANOCA